MEEALLGLSFIFVDTNAEPTNALKNRLRIITIVANLIFKQKLFFVFWNIH